MSLILLSLGCLLEVRVSIRHFECDPSIQRSFRGGEPTLSYTIVWDRTISLIDYMSTMVINQKMHLNSNLLWPNV